MYKLMGMSIRAISGVAGRQSRGRIKLNQQLAGYGLILNDKNYYGPFVSEHELVKPLDQERNIPGLNLDKDRMLEFVGHLNYPDELLAIPETAPDELVYSYDSWSFTHGDAEIFYGVIRHLKPRRIIEIGAGSSTLVAQMAIAKNKTEDDSYHCEHICIEPYENKWLEKLDITLIRKKVEEVPLSVFEDLDQNDILFVDSSHVVKPQGDVLFETFDIYGALKPGVYIHVHDIFTPRDYPRDWIIDKQILWHEQYLLEAFLSYNSQFEVVCALNWLWNNYPESLARACPVLTKRGDGNPGSFWFRRR